MNKANACDDGTTIYPSTLTVGVSAASLIILHLVKCRVQCSAVTMRDQTAVTNIPGQQLLIRPRRRKTMFEKHNIMRMIRR